MRTEQRNAIVDDLLRKYPRGPLGSLRKKDYRSETFHDYMTNDDAVRIVAGVDNYGYDKLTLFDLDLHSSYAIHGYLKKRLYSEVVMTGGRKGNLSKKTKRLWYRIRDIVWDVKKDGGAGVYKVYTGYSDTLGHVYAKNKDDASEISSMFFGHLTDSYQTIKVEFIKLGSPKSITKFNSEIISQLASSIESNQSTIEFYTDKITRMSATMQALTSVEKGQLNIIKGDKGE